MQLPATLLAAWPGSVPATGQHGNQDALMGGSTRPPPPVLEQGGSEVESSGESPLRRELKPGQWRHQASRGRADEGTARLPDSLHSNGVGRQGARAGSLPRPPPPGCRLQRPGSPRALEGMGSRPAPASRPPPLWRSGNSRPVLRRSDDSGLKGCSLSEKKEAPFSPRHTVSPQTTASPNDPSPTAGEAAMPKPSCWERGSLLGWARGPVSFGLALRTACGELRSPPDSTQLGLTLPAPQW